MHVPASSAAVPGADLHADALDAFAGGRNADALRLLVTGASRQVDLEQLNDLAVVAHSVGLLDDAHAVLRTVLLLDPENADAEENLRALESDVPQPSAPPADGFDAAQYWERRLAGEFGLGQVGFIGLGDAFNEWMYRVRRRVFRRHVRPLRCDWSTARVLDIGSGTGFYVENWLELGVRRLTASDITASAVDRLRHCHPGLDVRRLDIGAEDTGFEAGSFDAISAFDVLFHVVDDAAFARALRNMGTLLKPDGTLIFTDNFLHGESRRGSRHHVSRSLKEIEAAVAAAGLDTVVRRPAFVLMNDPVDTGSALHAMWWATLRRRLRSRPALGAVAGAALFPLEVAATRMLREGPSTELMVCRRAMTNA